MSWTPVQIRIEVGVDKPAFRATVDLQDLGRIRFSLTIPGTCQVTRSVSREQLIDIRNGAAMAIAALDAAAGKDLPE
jgi:invasion protein IalB